MTTATGKAAASALSIVAAALPAQGPYSQGCRSRQPPYPAKE
jgi:hypothetical protein